jgi:4-amino-4-deoxy-L-arabinose transferase-like glycosyltransferase
MPQFAIACAAGGIALRVLNALLGTGATFSSFSPAHSADPPQPGEARRSAALVVLALFAIGASLLAVLSRPDRSGFAVGAWVAAQIVLLAAAFDRPAPTANPSGRGRGAALFGLVLLGTAFSHFWELGQYPDFIHWDHGIYGSAALRLLGGEWSPFFVMDPNSPSISRPWVAVCALLLGLFGPHYWVLRLTGAISGVLLVVGTYLLGSSLLNRRVGLCAAFLASVNHVLWLYSRQSYVLDPAPFFVLALYCAVIGLRSGRRFPWCLAGVLSGWTLLTYWASTALVIVGAAIFGGFAVFFPRWLWRHRTGLAWMLLGAVVVYLPMVPHMAASANLTARLHDQTSVLNPDGSIQRDPAFWKNQVRQTFGMILQHGESSPWGVSTWRPIAIGPEAALFGIGLTYLIVSGRWGPALVLLPWIGFGFFFGNGLFRDPRTLYHCLAAIPPILIVSSVAVDRFLALTDRWKPRLLRAAPITVVLLVLGFIGLLHFRTVWQVVGRPASRHETDGSVLRADIRSIVPRYIRENPDYRYYLVRTSTGLSCAEPSFIFFADDSDVSDVTGELEEALPVPPTDQPRGVAFIVLPERSRDAGFIRTIYPRARTVQLFSTDTREPVRILLVDANFVRRAFGAAAVKRAELRISYGVVPPRLAVAGGYQKIGPGCPCGKLCCSRRPAGHWRSSRASTAS